MSILTAGLTVYLQKWPMGTGPRMPLATGLGKLMQPPIYLILFVFFHVFMFFSLNRLNNFEQLFFVSLNFNF